mgnify:CR=1 FL=1
MAESRMPKDLWEYWLGEGLKRWAVSPTPYRSLRRELLKYMPLRKASGLAAEIFHAHKGYWPGDKRHTGRDDRSH